MADTLEPSHVSSSATHQGSAAERAATRKEVKYANLTTSYCFVPLSFETLGAIHNRTLEFLNTLGKRLSAVSGDVRECSFLLQRLSVALQRFNCVCFRGSFVQPDVSEG